MEENEINIKNHEIELQRIYGGMYEDLLGEIRRKQHDYKNQLGAIRSIHMVAESNIELKDIEQIILTAFRKELESHKPKKEKVF